MADGDTVDPGLTPAAPDAAPTPEPSTSAEPSTPPSFGDALRAAAPTPQTFSQADIDARLASERETWQKANDEKYAWAKDLNPEEVQSWRQTIAEANQSPVEMATRLLSAALASGDPRHRQAALSFAGRLLAGRTEAPAAPGQAAPAPSPVDLTPIPATDGSGKTVNLYSVEQVQAIVDKAKAELRGELTPIQETFRTQAERQAAFERDQADRQVAVDIYERMSKKPGFKEAQKEIHEAWAKMAGNEDPATARENLHDAYTQVVFGKLQATSNSATAADNARRAAASTGRVVTPQPTQTSPSAPVSFAARLEQAVAKQRGA